MASPSRARAGLLAVCSGVALLVSSVALAHTVGVPGPRAHASMFASEDDRSGWIALAQNAPIYQPNTPPSPPAADGAPAAPAADDNDTTLNTIRARAFLGLGDYSSARGEVAMVLSRDPNNVGALRVLAAVDEATGRWRHAARHWARIAELSGDGAAEARRGALVRAHPSYAGVTGFFEGSPDVDQLSGVRLDFAHRPLDGPEWTAMLEHRIAKADAITRLDGTVTPADEEQQRLDIDVADNLPVGRISFRLSFTDETVGGRLSFGRSRPSGRFEISAGYDEPYWAYAAGVANGASINHVGANFDLWRGRIALRGRAAANEYNVSDEDSVARSITAAVGIDYALGDDPNAVRLTYILDAENFSEIAHRPRSDLTRYQVMPFVDRTVHSFGGYKYVGDREQRFAMFGLGYRRDTGSDAEGPYGAFATETPIGGNSRVGVRAEYSDVSTRGVSDEPFAFAELYFRRQF